MGSAAGHVGCLKGRTPASLGVRRLVVMELVDGPGIW
jgi:hypothetical protein